MGPTLTRLARAAADARGGPTDAQLLGAFIDRADGPAFEHLVRRHGPMVLAVCRRALRHDQDAEDAFQATFLVLARRAASVWPRAAVGGWLYGVARRVAMKAKSARRDPAPLPADVPAPPTNVPDPDLAEVIDRTLGTLPQAYRAAVVACDLDGLSRHEASVRLGWTEGTLSGRLARARRLLADRLRRRGVELPAGGLAALGGGAVSEAAVRGAVRVVEAGGATAPVVGLTNEVLRTMSWAKFKLAAVMVAVAVGAGVWSAAGDGGTGGRNPWAGGSAKARPADPTKNDLAALQGDWLVGKRVLADDEEARRDFEFRVPGGIAHIADKARAEGQLITVAGDRMSWPLLVISVGGTTTTSGEGSDTGTTASSGTTIDRSVTPRTYTVTLDATKSPRHIDLTADDGTVRRGIYKFEDGYFVLVLNEKGRRPRGFDKERVIDDEPMWTLWRLRASDPAEARRVRRQARPDPAVVAEAEKRAVAALRVLAGLDTLMADVKDPAVKEKVRGLHQQAKVEYAEAADAVNKLRHGARKADKLWTDSAFYVVLRSSDGTERVTRHAIDGPVLLADAVKRIEGLPKDRAAVYSWLMRRRDGRGDSGVYVDLGEVDDPKAPQAGIRVESGDRFIIELPE